MPAIHPFRALQYPPGDVSAFIAPPYDVLDAAGKAALLQRSPDNIVGIDLPHTPAKELGPPDAYARAADDLTRLINQRRLIPTDAPAIFAYRQTCTIDGVTVRRSGMACTVDALPFGPRAGGGILPHEETFSGPKQDRMALMRATRTQLSPIFGLHPDDKGRATDIIARITASRPPDRTAQSTWGDGVLHELWTITDPVTIADYQAALHHEDIFIADGHHRYTTHLNYLAENPSIPHDHHARRSMMVLVSMSDPGLVIWPTHRVLGGMSDYSWDKFLAAASADMRFEPIAGGLEALDKAVRDLTAMGEQRFGLWDFKRRQGAVTIPSTPDPLAARFPEKPRAWRDLTVAFCQYVIVEKICQSRLNAHGPVKWAFPHTIKEVADIGSGAETGAGGGAGFAQLAVIVRPTPLSAVRDVSRANQLMPQKSTFFYPKLATGLFIHPLT